MAKRVLWGLVFCTALAGAFVYALAVRGLDTFVGKGQG